MSAPSSTTTKHPRRAAAEPPALNAPAKELPAASEAQATGTGSSRTATETSSANSCLHRAAQRDQALSAAIHNADGGLLGDLLLLLPASLFQPWAVPLLLAIAFVAAPERCFWELLLGTLCTLGVTNALKARIGRARPSLLRQRIVNLRALEKNAAMPSGDAAQAALWAALLALHYQHAAPLLAVPLVALSRVYFGCHWLTDVAVGSVVGSAVGIAAHAASGAARAAWLSPDE